MASEHKVTQRKLTLVGDSCCGKTSLLRAALYGNSPEKVQGTFDLRHNVPFEQCPGIYECNVSNEKGHSIIIRLALWDTAGVYDFGRLEPLKYPGAHVVLISFAIDSPDSMDNVEQKVILPYALGFVLAIGSGTPITNCLLIAI
ncbi:small GTPase-binding protein [Penicillium subrubescens]|uniref:small GTPase-binding protein n=1 Tax=Penicillium subrubescens TaxID=1316194 RepID=UPI0025454004|nr:small GTPase-binding protein [Penicillium subrubescens]KAJ5904689.1 small GTPase-binding protein [Penicillium subrubescens]